MDAKLLSELESLVKAKGSLRISYSSDDGGMGTNWCATIGGEWPYCHGESIEGLLKMVVSEHRRLEREQLQKRLNEIDASANL